MSLRGPISAPAADPHAAKLAAWEMVSGLLEAARFIPGTLRAAPDSLPLTVIGGFLGAGKTTLLNELLVAPHGRRLAVLVNDFGRINIDASLVRSRTEDMISLENGCACCTVAGDLTRTLVQLAQREDPPEAIVLEASGLADPRGIAQIALANPALRLDGLLVVADAETLATRASDAATGAAFRAQLDAADLVVLSKLDLLDDAGHAAARAWITAEVPGRPVIEADRGRIPVEVVLGIQSGRDLRSEKPVPPVHASGIASWSALCEGALDAAKLDAMLAALPATLLRAKGILHLADDPAHRVVYQRVGARSSRTRGETWGADTPHSRLVCIGPEGALDDGELRRRLEACRSNAC